jgi:succinate dehydrogenase/fumarate reductase cytochrome b subunit
MILAHITIPLILFGLFPANVNLLALLLGSGIPNFDVFPTLLRKKTPKNALTELHAGSIVHTPFFFVLLFPIFYHFCGFLIAFSLSLGGIVHIVIEAFDEKGRRLLYPMSKKFYGIRLMPYDFWTYVTDKKVLAFETSLFVIACFVLLA